MSAAGGSKPSGAAPAGAFPACMTDEQLDIHIISVTHGRLRVQLLHACGRPLANLDVLQSINEDLTERNNAAHTRVLEGSSFTRVMSSLTSPVGSAPVRTNSSLKWPGSTKSTNRYCSAAHDFADKEDQSHANMFAQQAGLFLAQSSITGMFAGWKSYLLLLQW